MDLEQFINEKLCPARVVTQWHATVIRTAIALGDTGGLKAVLLELCHAAGVKLPENLITTKCK